MNKIEGGCLCGAVRYTSSEQPVVVAICHCLNCQRQSGAAFSINLGIPRGSLRFTGAAPATYEDRADSGLPVHRHFCGDCGSPILSEAEGTPTLDWLKAGTLDDFSWVRPQISVWCQSAQPWVVHQEGIPCYSQNPPIG